ncbi:MAG: protein-(glutamine-N5) methyltransferase, release factor-specific [Legionellales bacterium RIFCSPHIGHO2_12_FULL_37_14]|nr:MAG: protein-(glutamine-N5) methyltransferase, release factor-specific [Legionellales bacterium RIFCSPHIGHO2_12_FULL_37_14]
MSTIHEILRQGIISNLDSEVLLCFILKKPKSYLFSHPEYCLLPDELELYNKMLKQRRQGKPIAYITNTKEFWSLPFKVNRNTLIPRPETEILVERALLHIKDLKAPKILDLGTGCGAIAIAIAYERPDSAITAIDISKAALKVAQYNAEKLLKTAINFYQSAWFNNIPQAERFNLIVANPPYIALREEHLNLSSEPNRALYAGASGLVAIEKIIHAAKDYLLPGGLICIEHGYKQKNSVQQILHQALYTKIHTIKDLQGHDRITEATR